jgi:large subunit ribosomal protein L23
MVTLRRPPKYQRSGPVLEPYQVVIRPLITEKATHISERDNAYTFEVNPLATKTEIKSAIETLFDVKVSGVRTQNRRGKPRRYRPDAALEEGHRHVVRGISNRLLLRVSRKSNAPGPAFFPPGSRFP